MSEVWPSEVDGHGWSLRRRGAESLSRIYRRGFGTLVNVLPRWECLSRASGYE